jgi:hypothetical protein
MMTAARQSFVAGAVIVASVGATLLAWLIRPGPPPPPAATLSHVFRFTPDDVVGFALDGEKGRLRARRGDNGWQVSEVVSRARVDTASATDAAPPVPSATEIDGALNELVRDVAGLPEVDRFPREGHPLDEYGLDHPQIKITLTLRSGSAQVLEIGAMTVTSTAIYARSVPPDDVLQVGTLVLSELDAALYRLRGLAKTPATQPELPESRAAS